MQFVFDEPKTAQAAAYLLSLRDDRMSYMKLIKLLYIADRHALLETGYPLTGDAMYSMPHGPVLSRVLDFIHDGTSAIWRKYISSPTADYEVSRVGELETDRLSEYDIEVLERVDSQFGDLDQWQLEDYTHANFPEWEDPDGSRLPIDASLILEDAGWEPADVQHVSSQTRAVSAFQKRFAHNG